MEQSTLWWLMAGAAVIAELLTGTFYLLMLALGLAGCDWLTPSVDTVPVQWYEPVQALVVAHDTGGAIRGPARTDFFWGWGPEAGDRAGRMRDEAEVFVLLPRPIEVATAPDTP